MEQNGKLYLTSDESVLFDNNYRYKISIIEIRHMMKKGTKITILSNFEKFSNELQFDGNILLRIVSKCLSCKCGYDKTNNIYYLQGDYDCDVVKETIYNFIKKYLLCSVCDKPEVTIKYKKENIKQKCRACGNNDYLLDCNENIIHILKNVN